MLCAAARRRRTEVVDLGVLPRGTSVSQLRTRPGPNLVGHSLAGHATTAAADPAHRRQDHGVVVPGQPSTTASGWSPSTTPAPTRVAGYRSPARSPCATCSAARAGSPSTPRPHPPTAHPGSSKPESSSTSPWAPHRIQRAQRGEPTHFGNAEPAECGACMTTIIVRGGWCGAGVISTQRAFERLFRARRRRVARRPGK